MKHLPTECLFHKIIILLKETVNTINYSGSWNPQPCTAALQSITIRQVIIAALSSNYLSHQHNWYSTGGIF